MWKSDQWQLFLSECEDYPEENLATDAKFLSEQKLGPSQFNSLIEMYDRDLLFFKQCFPIFALGNLIRFINGLKCYVSKKGAEGPVFSKTVEAFDVSPPHNKMRHTFDIRIVSPRHSSWFQEIKKFMFFFIGNEDEENRRCVSAFAPSFAVTYAHLTNSTLSAPDRNENGKITKAGSVFKVYSFDTDGQGKSQKEVNVHVVAKDEHLDYIILEALNGATFFDSDRQHILKRPTIGTEFLCCGLSASLEPHPIEGIVMATELKQEKYRNRRLMLADCAVWSGDSGGGIFNTDNQLLGIVHADLGRTRTLFVPAGVIKAAWEVITEPWNFHQPLPEDQ